MNDILEDESKIRFASLTWILQKDAIDSVALGLLVLDEEGLVLMEYYTEGLEGDSVLDDAYHALLEWQKLNDERVHFVLNWDTPLLSDPLTEENHLYFDGNTLLTTVGLLGVMPDKIWQIEDTVEYNKLCKEVFDSTPDLLLAIAYGKGVLARNMIQAIRMIALEGLDNEGRPNIDVSISPYEYLVDNSC